jgi:hypothetical protein
MHAVNLNIIPESSLESFEFNLVKYIADNTFTLAYKICPEVQLKPLDVLQIASAMKIKQYSSIDLHYFVTNDKGIMSNIETIQLLSSNTPISSLDLVTLLNLPF